MLNENTAFFYNSYHLSILLSLTVHSFLYSTRTRKCPKCFHYLLPIKGLFPPRSREDQVGKKYSLGRSDSAAEFLPSNYGYDIF